MSPGTALTLGAVLLGVGALCGWGWPRLWLLLTLAGALCGLLAAGLVLFGPEDLLWEFRSGAFTVGGESLHLRLDALSALFLALVCTVGAAGAVYSREYWSDAHHPGSAPRGRAVWNALLLAMGCVLVSANGLHFLLAWELFALCAYFLVTLDRHRRAAREAGRLFLVCSHAGTVCLFAFFAALAAHTGGWDLGPLRGHAELGSLFWLALVGFGLKSGVFPLHIWLPSAHASAPSHVSALMSGVALNMGVYGLVRFSGWLPVPPAAGWVLLVMGSCSAVLGIAYALVQGDLKRLLAYCSVENIGVILVGLGAALVGLSRRQDAWEFLALAGALFHVWNHGIMKALLFLGAGSVLEGTGTREMSRLGGLWRLMPWTTVLFALGAAALCGLPPLNGFVSEWLVCLGLLGAVSARGWVAWPAVFGVLMLGAAGALALATFIKAGAVVFLGAPRTKAAEGARECGPCMRGAMQGLALLGVASGVAPMLLWPAVLRAARVWHPAAAWNSEQAGTFPAPMSALGAVQASLAVLGALGAWALWRRAAAGRRPPRRALTWDCGMASPTARIQYTGGSLSGIPAGWFAWIMQPERTVRRPHGPFPARAFRLERIPETVLERQVEPAGRRILSVSETVRRLQHGRVQAYLVYMLAGLAGLGLLVYLGPAP